MDPIMKRNLHFLVDYTVNFDNLFKKLKSRGLFTPEESEDIEKVYDSRHQILKMYMKLARHKGERKMEIFECLRESNNGHIVQKLVSGSFKITRARFYEDSSTSNSRITSQRISKDFSIKKAHIEKLCEIFRKDSETFDRWEDVSRELLEKKDFCKIQRESYLLSIEDLITKTLENWLENCLNEATLENLLKILINCGLRHIAGKIKSQIEDIS